MTREETAEWVGCYFGLQQAGNILPAVERGEDSDRSLNALRAVLDARMKDIQAKLPPGTIDSWPSATKRLG